MKNLSKINIIILLCILISGTTGQHAAGKTLPKAGEAGVDKSCQGSNGVTVFFHGPVEAVLTDNQGRRLGYDPVVGQAYEEIPLAITTTFSQDIHDDGNGEIADEEPTKQIEIPDPVGEYSLSIVGTGNGMYSFNIHSFDQDQHTSADNELSDVPITINEIHQYKFQFFNNAASSDQLKVWGGYNGGGQKPLAVNKFLTYVRPAAHTTDLPCGVSAYPVIIYYDKAITPQTFTAKLNGINITNKFHPVAGNHEIVNIFLSKGRNNLILSTDGNIDSQTRTDTDNLFFNVDCKKADNNAKPSAVQSRSADALKKGCELTVHIKGAHPEGGFRILTKEDFANKNIEKAIFIGELRQYGTALSSQSNPHSSLYGEMILYIKYKEGTDRTIKTDMWHYFNDYRRIMRLDKAQMEKEKLLPFDFTHYELIKAVEKLVYKDELKLAGATISVKKRVIKELPDEMFKMDVTFHPKNYGFSPVPRTDSW